MIITTESRERNFLFVFPLIQLETPRQISNTFFSVGFYQLNHLRQAALSKISNLIKNSLTVDL